MRTTLLWHGLPIRFETDGTDLSFSLVAQKQYLTMHICHMDH
jgi:hypothetical protein